MANKGNFLAQAVLDFIYGLDANTPPAATLYVALNYVLPDADGTGGSEVTGTGYAREAVAVGGANFDRTDQIVTNLNDIDFGTAGSDWAPPGDECVGFSIWDHITNTDNLVYQYEFTAPRIILNGDPVKIPAGGLQITEI